MASDVTSRDEGFGDRVQYSVFVCDLSEVELIKMKTSLELLIDRGQDSIMVIDLGSEDASRFTFMGQPLKLPNNSALII